MDDLNPPKSGVEISWCEDKVYGPDLLYVPAAQLSMCAAAASAWMAFAVHQEHCRCCGEAVSDCESGTKLKQMAEQAHKLFSENAPQQVAAS